MGVGSELWVAVKGDMGWVGDSYPVTVDWNTPGSQSGQGAAEIFLGYTLLHLYG